jgi:glycosyltransferase involved in cell wall biosynthesis
MEVERVNGTSVDVLVCTFNSERCLSACLDSARRYLPVGRLIVVDHHSTDRTVEIARAHGAELHLEDRGLGFARVLGISLASTELLVVLDSDVIIESSSFYPEATRLLADEKVGAVVGMAIGHRFLYGLPFSLTVIRRGWAASVRVPESINARETFYYRERLRSDGLRIRYVLDAMRHFSHYRGHKPEWEGANTRLAAGLSLYQLAYAFLVVTLIHANSRSPRNMLYTPIFYLKFLRGFSDPQRWRVLDRRVEPAG